MLIEYATVKDIARLVEIENELFDSNNFPLSKNNFYYHIKKNNLFLVAKYNSVLVGYILILNKKNSKIARIYSFGISKYFQGHGFAQKLLNESFSHVRSYNANINAMSLEVRADNVKAIALYKKMGFRQKEILYSYYLDNENAIKMIKNI